MTRSGAALLAACALLASCALISGADDLVVEPLDGAPIAPLEASIADGGADRGDVPLLDGGDAEGGVDRCDIEGLIAWWKLDENGGTTIHDCSPNGLDGQLDGGVWVPGRDGGAAIALDGGWIGLGDPPQLRLTGAFTIAAWINEEVATATTQYILGRRAGTGAPGWRFATEPPELSFNVSPPGNPTGGVAKEGMIPSRTWVHAAGVYVPGQTMVLYLDGARVGALDAGVPNAVANPNVEPRIGARSDDQFPFIGTLDDVRVYGRALSPAEIAALAAE